MVAVFPQPVDLVQVYPVTTWAPPRVTPVVVHQTYPPTSGSVRCGRCTGWIVSGSTWYVSDSQKPYCDECVRRAR